MQTQTRVRKHATVDAFESGHSKRCTRYEMIAILLEAHECNQHRSFDSKI